MYARRNLFRRMCHNAGRISGTGNSIGISIRQHKEQGKEAGSRNVICLIFVQKGA